MAKTNIFSTHPIDRSALIKRALLGAAIGLIVIAFLFLALSINLLNGVHFG
jgi:hypothetical protein